MMPVTAPRGLLPKARKFWADVTEAYDLRTDELRMLEDACREIDLIGRIDAELKNAPLTTHGHAGQPVAAPLVSEVRQHRAVLRGLLLALHLPDENGTNAAGDRSSAGRALVMARYR